MVPMWRLVVWACAAYLLILGAMVFIRPAAAIRFLDGLASSRPLNSLEAVLRLIAGLAFMGASPEMKHSAVFFWFGALLAATAIPMMFLYDLHRRFRPQVGPLVRRFLAVYGIIAIALGAAIAWALS
ncbi:MAG: hypothetical protein WAW96_20535 [Alphaproteobacteria bacterium]